MVAEIHVAAAVASTAVAASVAGAAGGEQKWEEYLCD